MIHAIWLLTHNCKKGKHPMDYQFPYINTIDDVLPAVHDRTEFVIADRGTHTIINYNVETPGMFDLGDGGVLRRESRGIIFDNHTGKILRRPLHKFANINQWAETQQHLLDFSSPHVIMLKEDGSMMSPFFVGTDLVWGTKMGATEVAELAVKYVQDNQHYEDFAVWCIRNDLTPIFEYVGPDNKIVLDYSEKSLILLAIRHMHSGAYVDLHKIT